MWERLLLCVERRDGSFHLPLRMLHCNILSPLLHTPIARTQPNISRAESKTEWFDWPRLSPLPSADRAPHAGAAMYQCHRFAFPAARFNVNASATDLRT
jgi:hypothetical protein